MPYLVQAAEGFEPKLLLQLHNQLPLPVSFMCRLLKSASAKFLPHSIVLQCTTCSRVLNTWVSIRDLHGRVVLRAETVIYFVNLVVGLACS